MRRVTRPGHLPSPGTATYASRTARDDRRKGGPTMDGTAGPKDRNPTAEAPRTTRSGARRASATERKISPASAKRLPVRKGEDQWTAGELAAVRDRLEREMADLRTEIATA